MMFQKLQIYDEDMKTFEFSNIQNQYSRNEIVHGEIKNDPIVKFV